MTTEFLTQLHQLHYGTSRLAKKNILPKQLLDFVSEILADAYQPPLREYLEKSYRAVNAFRDGLPPEAFEKFDVSLLTKTASFPLPYKPFADFFREAKYYPPYRLDFSEPKPGFYQYEPDDPDDRRRWRDDRREYQDELSDWKERKRVHERRHKELPKLTPVQEALLGTPFPTDVPETWEYQVPFCIDPQHRFAHKFVRATTRSGKTNYLACKILDDLERVKKGEASVIAMESHSVLVPKLAKLKMFGRGGALEGQFIHLRPLRQDLSLNIFDNGKHDDLDDEQRSAFYRDTLRTVQFFINSIVKTDTSSQQDIVLKLLTQAVLCLRNPTIADIEALLEPKGIDAYRDKFIGIDPFVLNALEKQLHTDFKQSTIAMRGRVTGIKTDPLFRKMFAHKQNRLDLFAELKTPKVILVDTAGLGDATQAFGRFFLAKLYEASLKRRLLAENSPSVTKPPIYLYVDEAHDYISDEPLIAKMIDTVGKDGLAMIFATQRERTIMPDVLDALSRVYTQSNPRWPMVNIVLDPTEPPDPPREPVKVRVQLIDWGAFPQMNAAEQLSIHEQMLERFGPKTEMEPEPLPRAEKPEAPKPKSEKVKPKPETPKPEEDETDAKPW